MGLRHFQSDRPAADDEETARQSHSIEDGFVRIEGNRIETGYRRDRRAGAGGDDEAACGDAVAAGLDFARCDELARRMDDFDAEALETFGRIVWCDRRDDRTNMTIDAGLVDLGRRTIDAEARCLAGCFRGMSGGQQGFGRDAAVIEAVSAHLRFFD